METEQQERDQKNIEQIVKNEIGQQFKLFFSYKKLIVGIISTIFTLLVSVYGVYTAIGQDLDKKYASKSEATGKFQVQEEVNKNMLEDLKDIKQDIKQNNDDLKIIIKDLGTLGGKIENLSPNRRSR